MSTQTSKETIRVVVVDDQAIIRDGLVTILRLTPNIDVVAEAANGNEAIKVCVEQKPDVVLMDLRMPECDGVEATVRLARDVPTAAVLVLTTFADDESITAALQAGARGYLTKDAGREELATAIQAVARGQATFDAAVSSKLISVFTASAQPKTLQESIAQHFPELTSREGEVLGLMCAGQSNSEMARKLFVSVSTIKTHVNSLFSKLKVRTRADAIARAQQVINGGDAGN